MKGDSVHMALFAIGDTHLSYGTEKPMDIFKGWQDYEQRLKSNWEKIVTDRDTVIIAGDISWAMRLEEAIPDFDFLNRLPGQKIIIKGNHDYWWNTLKKLTEFTEKHEFETIHFLYNNAYRIDKTAVCGTRGWIFNCTEETDRLTLLREAGRLRESIKKAKALGGEPVAFLHYPPVTEEDINEELVEVMLEEGIKSCYYGHLHGYSSYAAVKPEYMGIKFSLISCDFLKFCPKLII